jgi:hypothetical protein
MAAKVQSGCKSRTITPPIPWTAKLIERKCCKYQEKRDLLCHHPANHAVMLSHVVSNKIGGSKGQGGIIGTSPLNNLGHDFSKINVIAHPIIRAKLAISQPRDACEIEADKVARHVVRDLELSPSEKSSPGISKSPISIHKMIQRQESSFPEDSEDKLTEEEGQIQLKKNEDSVASPDMELRLDSLAGQGQRLPNSIKTRMEDSFGASFDDIRIHADGEAARLSRSIGAEAFTFGRDIYFGANKFDPVTRGGKELLAHELTHSLQQNGISRKAVQRRGGSAVGQLDINSNVISKGLTDGHAWLGYRPSGGARTTYGTWGNKTPIGLHRDLELGYRAAATRRTDLDAGDYSSLTSFASANNSWSLTNNCASFAARGWEAVTGESLSYTTAFIPNPSALGAGIVAANGGSTGVLSTAPPARGSSEDSSS